MKERDFADATFVCDFSHDWAAIGHMSVRSQSRALSATLIGWNTDVPINKDCPRIREAVHAAGGRAFLTRRSNPETNGCDYSARFVGADRNLSHV